MPLLSAPQLCPTALLRAVVQHPWKFSLSFMSLVVHRLIRSCLPLCSGVTHGGSVSFRWPCLNRRVARESCLRPSLVISLLKRASSCFSSSRRHACQRRDMPRTDSWLDGPGGESSHVASPRRVDEIPSGHEDGHDGIMDNDCNHKLKSTRREHGTGPRAEMNSDVWRFHFPPDDNQPMGKIHKIPSHQRRPPQSNGLN